MVAFLNYFVPAFIIIFATLCLFLGIGEVYELISEVENENTANALYLIFTAVWVSIVFLIIVFGYHSKCN